MSTGAPKSDRAQGGGRADDADCTEAHSESSADNRTYAGQLWKQAELLAQAEKIGNLGTWEFDVTSRRLVLSENLCNLLGYPHGTQIHEEEYWDLVHPDDREDARQVAALGVLAGRHYEYVARLRSVDRTVHYHLMSGLPISGKNGKVERVIGLYRDVTNEVHSEDELHKLSQQLMRARDDERRHVARELHESAGQTLAGLKMTLARIEEELPTDCETAHALLRSS